MCVCVLCDYGEMMKKYASVRVGHLNFILNIFIARICENIGVQRKRTCMQYAILVDTQR